MRASRRGAQQSALFLTLGRFTVFLPAALSYLQEFSVRALTSGGHQLHRWVGSDVVAWWVAFAGKRTIVHWPLKRGTGTEYCHFFIKWFSCIRTEIMQTRYLKATFGVEIRPVAQMSPSPAPVPTEQKLRDPGPS